MKFGLSKLILGLSFAALIGCSEKHSTHPVLRFFPPESILEDGYVSKFYEHYYPTSTNQSASTRISYFLYKKSAEDGFTLEIYNAGFWLTRKQYFHVEEATLHLDSSVNIWRTDTTVINVTRGLLLDWGKDSLPETHYKIEGIYDTHSFAYEARQIGVRDTVIEESPVKVFTQDAKQTVSSEDTTETKRIVESYYVSGLGFYGLKETLDTYTWEMELVEQMPLAKFQALANHEEKRVAYIDPEKALSHDADFELCGHEKFIADYYNSTPDGDYFYGKAALVDTMLTNLDAEKMMNQTGMLTFRFVVNCNGEAGRFTAKGYDQNYQPYKFPEVTINHLYEQMKRLKKWRVVVINDEPRDAYFYFTFKLNNGEIIDILP